MDHLGPGDIAPEISHPPEREGELLPLRGMSPVSWRDRIAAWVFATVPDDPDLLYVQHSPRVLGGRPADAGSER
jgi:hypothetical protein